MPISFSLPFLLLPLLAIENSHETRTGGPIRSRPKLTERSTERANDDERTYNPPRNSLSGEASAIVNFSPRSGAIADRVRCVFAPLICLFSLLVFLPRESRGLPESRSRSVAARSSVGGLRMTSCDRSPRNAPALSLLLPRSRAGFFVLRPALAASCSRPRVFARGALALSRSLPGGVREGERNRRAIAGLPRRRARRANEKGDEEGERENERKCTTCASAKNVYT